MKTYRLLFNTYLLGIFSLLASCRPSPHDVRVSGKQPEIFPDYIGVTIPQDIAPMNFSLTSKGVEAVTVKVSGSSGGEIWSKKGWFAPKDVAQFDLDEWHALTRQNVGGELTFVVTALIDEEWQEFAPFTMRVSEYPLGEYGITYRRIAPGFETFSDIGMYQRSLCDFKEEAMFDVKDVDGQCMNCHYANRTSAEQYLVHVRGKHGATYIYNKGKESYLNTKTEETCGSCTYGYWHPDGRFCAFSLNKAFQNFYTGNRKIIEPWDQVSDIVVLDVEANELLRSPLLEGPDFQTTPTFSPDGKTIYFSAAPFQKMPAEYEKVKYSICAISFDPEAGTFGEKIDTLLNGTAADKSFALARPSYDGKFLMYCMTDYGTTPINRIESDLWLMDLETGETRRMDEVNSPETDAYHNWSTNSRWFVFGSKREDHLYSLPYFASIDDKGVATKPFLLPQENPKKYYLENLHSFNVPDFTAARVDFRRKDFSEKILNGERIQVRVK